MSVSRKLAARNECRGCEACCLEPVSVFAARGFVELLLLLPCLGVLGSLRTIVAATCNVDAVN